MSHHVCPQPPHPSHCPSTKAITQATSHRKLAPAYAPAPISFNQQAEPVYQSYSTIFPITGQYVPHARPVPDIHNICECTNGTSWSYHLPHAWLVPDTHNMGDCTNGTGWSYHVPHAWPVPD